MNDDRRVIDGKKAVLAAWLTIAALAGGPAGIGYGKLLQGVALLLLAVPLYSLHYRPSGQGARFGKLAVGALAVAALGIALGWIEKSDESVIFMVVGIGWVLWVCYTVHSMYVEADRTRRQ